MAIVDVVDYITACALRECALFPSLQPADSLNRPTELIPPSSPIRFRDLCNGKNRSSTAGGEQDPPSFGIPGESAAGKNDCEDGNRKVIAV